MDISNYRFIAGVVALAFCAGAFVSETHSYDSQLPPHIENTPSRTTLFNVPAVSIDNEEDECVEDSSDVDVLQSPNEYFVCRFA